jgi:hypothetical protein
MSAATASAQWPGGRYSRGYYDGYDGDAVAAAAALGSADAASRNAAQSYQAWAQRAASPQMTGMENGIRSAVGAGDQQRSQNIYNQQQAGRDWWFQVQQQQMSQRQQAPQYATMPAGFESAPAPPAPKVATDIIKWPAVLQAQQFADQRAQIEAPYRRSPKGLSRPTAEDYQNMIKAADQMKVILKGLATKTLAQEYLDTLSFIDKLAAEARERLEQATPKK